MMWQFLGRDRVIEDAMTQLAMEAKSGSPSGRLYAESACEFLAHHIIHSYSSMSTVTAAEPTPTSSMISIPMGFSG
jgi:hypothetical protein